MERRASATMPVHPRVGGEHFGARVGSTRGRGSSPRGRGTLCDEEVRRFKGRFIPAWAGNTLHREPGVRSTAVHPRVGGEHIDSNCGRSCGVGSSPRGRGTHQAVVALLLVARFIPAWAGNTSGSAGSAGSWSVHPRVGGEHDSAKDFGGVECGSSPRGRGTP